MRVAINSAFLGESYNGMHTYVRGLMATLPHVRSNEQEFLIYSPRPDIVPFDEAFHWVKTPRWLSSDRGTSGNLARFLWTQSVLTHELRTRAVDILFCPVTEGILSSDIPQVIVVHDLIPLRYREECPRLYYYFKRIAPALLRRAACVIAVSERTREDLIDFYGIRPEKISVVYNGIEPFYFTSNGLPQAPLNCPKEYFLFVGRDSKRKNPQTLLRAFKIVKTQLAHWLVLVSPDEQGAKQLSALARRHGVLDRTRVYSRLPIPQMAYLYERATALVLLSGCEGFGYPPLEAMAMGTPAIVSESTSLAEVGGDGAIPIPAYDVSRAAQSLIELATDQQLCDSLSQKARARALRFQWESTARGIAGTFAKAKLRA